MSFSFLFQQERSYTHAGKRKAHRPFHLALVFPLYPGVGQPVMKSLKDVSLFAALCVALMALAIAASPGMKVACQAQSSAVHLSEVEAPAPIGPVLFELHGTRISFESGSDQSSDRCDSDGETVHAYGCHSHAMPDACPPELDPGSPQTVVITPEHRPTGGTVQPPVNPPRIPT